MLQLTLSEIANFFGLRCFSNAKVSSFAIDSRCVEKGGVFFALEGNRVDGHAFVAAALERGAIGVVVSKPVDVDVPVLRVPDTLVALQQLAGWVYRQRAFPVIGVTGSMGKTLTKDFIAHLLSQQMRVAKTQKSWNSQRTLPLGILNCAADAEVAVFEYAMSQKGQMARLLQMAPPDLGVLTPVGLVHAENFESLEEIEAEKRLLLSGTVQAFVHYRNRSWPGAILYGSSGKGPYRERHLNENYDAAVRVCRYFGFEPEREKPPLAEKRSQIVRKNKVIFYNDSYNANVDSFAAAFASCPKGSRQIVVIGSMGELGKFSKECHKKVGEMARSADLVLCVGKECQVIAQMLQKKACLYDDYAELLAALKELAQPGDVVLVKGSKVHGLWRLVEDF